jgi:hypothetical protein
MQGFDDQKLKKKKQLTFFKKSKIAIYLSEASRKNFQATGDAFSPQRAHPALQNMKFINFFKFSTFMVNFCPPGSGLRIRKRIYKKKNKS